MPLSEFANLSISKIITHEIFKRGNNKEIISPVLNDELTVLNQDGLSTLADRIVAAIGKDSKSIEMSIRDNSQTSVFAYAASIFEDDRDDNFIEKSKDIANKLVNAQTSRNLPGGIVILIKGTSRYGEYDLVLVIKAELQSGFKKSNNNDIEFVNNLLLTPYQKMYKLGVFLKKDSQYRVFVYDHNLSKSEEQGLSQYFYDSFLGLKMLYTNKFLTSKFYNGTKQFISSLANITDEDKYDLNTHLYSYMKNEAIITISLVDFSDTYIIDADIRDQYITYMRAEIFNDMDFNRSITKDISEIKSKLRVRRIVFSTGVKILGASDDFEQNVQIINQESNENNEVQTILKVKGEIKGS